MKTVKVIKIIMERKNGKTVLRAENHDNAKWPEIGQERNQGEGVFLNQLAEAIGITYENIEGDERPFISLPNYKRGTARDYSNYIAGELFNKNYITKKETQIL